MRLSRGLPIISLAVVAQLCAPAHAENWSYRITPYVWTPSLTTTLGFGANPPVEGSKSILDVLDGAFLLYGEARKGAWGVLGEINYLNLSDQFGTTPIGDIGDWRLKGVMGSISATYAFSDRQGTRVEALAGLRGWNIDASTTVLSTTAIASLSWVDPIVGMRFSTPLGENVDLVGMANVGGFGVGSDFQWEALAQVTWNVSDLITISGGYRHLHLDFQDQGAVVDLTLGGPFVGLGFNF